MSRLFTVILISLSTLLFACDGESSSNSNSSGGADGSSVVDDNESADDMDEDSSEDAGEDAGSVPSGGGAGGVPSGGGIGNTSDEIDARNETIQQDLNTRSQPDPVTSTEVEPTAEPIDLEPIDNDDGNSLDPVDD